MVTMPAGHANAGAGPTTAGKPPTASVGKRFSFTEKRSAGHVLQRHYANAGSNLSADWLKKVEWAKQVLPDYTEQSPRAQAQAKRQRSQEAPGPSAKKSRVQPGRSFAQIAKERILIGVLDQGNADGRIPRNQWKWVETALATRCFEMLDSEPRPPPICKDVGWYQGNVKVIDDERSAELYKAAVSKIGEVYPGAKLVAIDWKDVPVRPRARLWIPSSMKEPDKLLLMLQSGSGSKAWPMLKRNNGDGHHASRTCKRRRWSNAAEAPVGAATAGKPPTASVGKRFSFTEKRSAGHVLQRHYANAGSNLSADWLKKVEWAKQVLPDYTEQSPRAQAQAKRQRSQEAPGPSAKKSRVQPGRSFAQIAKERILIGVLDQGNADGRIPRNQWKWVETALATRCFEMLDSEPGPPPICKDVGWYQGNVKVIDDERSAELYKAAVSKIGEVYPGAKLVAIDWKDVPVRPRARLWIPSSMKEPDKLLLMLQRCNPSLPTHDWKVANIEEMPGPTSQAVIILNKESLAPIDAAGGELNFGFSSVFIRVYKSDATPANGLSDKPAEEDITEEL
ncbi:hypothetical protein ACLKA7_000954 [Drosophila subpalustris]